MVSPISSHYIPRDLGENYQHAGSESSLAPKKVRTVGGSKAQWLAYLFLDPAAPGLISNIPNIAEVNQRRSSEESGQGLENVDRTLLVLASGKLVLQVRTVSIKKWPLGPLTERWTQTRQERARAKRANLEVTILLLKLMFRRLLPSSTLSED